MKKCNFFSQQAKKKGKAHRKRKGYKLTGKNGEQWRTPALAAGVWGTEGGSCRSGSCLWLAGTQI